MAPFINNILYLALLSYAQIKFKHLISTMKKININIDSRKFAAAAAQQDGLNSKVCYNKEFSEFLIAFEGRETYLWKRENQSDRAEHTHV